MAFWIESDVWSYLRGNKISYCPIYDKGETNPGCIFCMFGCGNKRGDARFDRLNVLHPKLYDYCMNHLGVRGVLDFINKRTP